MNTKKKIIGAVLLARISHDRINKNG